MPHGEEGDVAQAGVAEDIPERAEVQRPVGGEAASENRGHGPHEEHAEEREWDEREECPSEPLPVRVLHRRHRRTCAVH